MLRHWWSRGYNTRDEALHSFAAEPRDQGRRLIYLCVPHMSTERLEAARDGHDCKELSSRLGESNGELRVVEIASKVEP